MAQRGDNITAKVRNVSGQIAVGKEIQQHMSNAAVPAAFQTEAFLDGLRTMRKIVADLDIEEGFKESLEDQIANMRQEVKRAQEENKAPQTNKISDYLKKTNAAIETLDKAGDTGKKLFPILQTLANLAGFSLG